MKKKQNGWWLLLPPLTVLIGFGLVFFAKGLYPFGTGTVSWCDMNQQVLPLLAEFKQILRGEGGFFLSLNNAAGLNFWGVFFFFLASPFSFLVLLVPDAELMGFMNVLTALKLAASALTAGIWFEHQRRRDGVRWGVGLLLSLMYAFSAYGMLYYQNSIWLDEMALLPLLVLGLEYLTEKGRAWLYGLMIGLSVAINYYIGYMTVLFSLLYLGLFCWTQGRAGMGRIVLRFAAASLIAALTTALAWLPSLLQVAVSARTGKSVLENLLNCNFVARLNTTVPLLLGTAAVFPTVLLARLFGIRIQKRRLFEWGLFLLLIVPVFLEPVNKLWQTGDYMSFPTRYGFITLFLGLMVLYRVLARAKAMEEKNGEKTLPLWAQILLFIPALAAVGAYTWFSRYWFEGHTDTIMSYAHTLWGSEDSLKQLAIFFGVGCGAYALAFLLYRLGLRKGICLILAGCLLTAEAMFSVNVYMTGISRGTEKYSALWELRNRLDTDTTGRIKTTHHFMDENWEGMLGVPALSHYTSLNSEDYLFGLKKLGYNAYWMKSSSYGGTLFSDALLSVKYTVGTKYENYGHNSLIYNDYFSLWENEAVFPFGIVADADSLGTVFGERVPYQEAIFEQLFAEEGEQLFERYEFTSESDVLEYRGGNYCLTPGSDAVLVATVKVEEPRRLYFDLFDQCSTLLNEPVNGSVTVLVNGVPVISEYPKQSENCLLDLGDFADETVEISVRVEKYTRVVSFGLFGLDTGLLNTVLERYAASGNKVELTKRANGFSGTVTAVTAGSCFLPLAFDKGYQITVNGTPVEYYKTYECFLAFPVSAGENTVEISYVSPGFKTGCILSAAGLLLAAAALIFLRRAADPNDGTEEKGVARAALFAMQLLTAVLIAAVYVFPLLWNQLGALNWI